MASRKHHQMTERQDTVLGATAPKILPGANGKTRMYFRSAVGGSQDLMLEQTATGFDLYQNPDGSPTLLGSIPGSGSGPTAGSYGVAVISPSASDSVKFLAPFACSITAWKIWADAGTITFDIRKVAFASAPPTGGNSIVAAAPPALSSGVTASSSTLTGWTTTIARGEAMDIVVSSAAGVGFAVLLLEVTKT